MNIKTIVLDKLRGLYHTKKSKSEKWNSFKKDFILFKKLDTDKRFEMNWLDIYPCLDDKTSVTYFEGHYTYHPAWAARVIKKIAPVVHVDISSTLHFCSIVSAFQDVEFYDYRPAPLKLEGLITGKTDLTNLQFDTDSIQSLSCMHTIEHIGLGRYGDMIDPNADLKAIQELKRVVTPGGNLIIVVPIGHSRLLFNAHRIYSYQQICSYFEPFTLKEFSLVPDNYLETGMIANASQNDADNQNWGCGCFWFIK
jgi:SAM-dependent methyltransferase